MPGRFTNHCAVLRADSSSTRNLGSPSSATFKAFKRPRKAVHLGAAGRLEGGPGGESVFEHLNHHHEAHYGLGLGPEHEDRGLRQLVILIDGAGAVAIQGVVPSDLVVQGNGLLLMEEVARELARHLSQHVPVAILGGDKLHFAL